MLLKASKLLYFNLNKSVCGPIKCDGKSLYKTGRNCGLFKKATVLFVRILLYCADHLKHPPRQQRLYHTETPDDY